MPAYDQVKLQQFLFQTGSIKRRWFYLLEYPLLTCFYSKLVRLKGDRVSFQHQIRTWFLFQTGSIKRLLLFRRLTNATKFLFQTGSIKSQKVATTNKELRKSLKSFYSKLVRLKAKSRGILSAPLYLVSIPNWFD